MAAALAAARLWFRSRPDLQGVKTSVSPLRLIPRYRFRSRPDLQGVKTPRGPRGRRCRWGSEADPIFRGSKLWPRQGCGRRGVPKQTRSSGGQNAAGGDLLERHLGVPKQTRSSGGQNAWRIDQPTRSRVPKQTRSSGGQNSCSRPPCSTAAFRSRPDLQGVKTRRAARRCLGGCSEADPIFRGSKRRARRYRAHAGFRSRPDLQGVKTDRRGTLPRRR